MFLKSVLFRHLFYFETCPRSRSNYKNSVSKSQDRSRLALVSKWWFQKTFFRPKNRFQPVSAVISGSSRRFECTINFSKFQNFFRLYCYFSKNLYPPAGFVLDLRVPGGYVMNSYRRYEIHNAVMKFGNAVMKVHNAVMNS